MLDLSSVKESDQQTLAQIAKDANVDLKDCYQCGKCTAGCPMAHEMDVVPRKVIRMMQMGLLDKVLHLRSPWVCAQCSVCSARCPQEVEIAALMLQVRLEAKRRGIITYRDSDLFDDIFIGNVRRFGRSNEAILAMLYNLKSGHLFQDVLNAPKMAARGMIGPKIHKIAGRAKVQAMVDGILKDEAGAGGAK
jgi:heterodisulfide reductase subunit C